jgi:peptide/nickel transport system permease protein
LKSYILKRLLLMIPTLFGVSIVVFAIVTSAPEPPISAQMPSDLESAADTGGAAGTLPQAVKVFRAQYGLDKPKVLNTYYAVDTEEVEQTLKASLDKSLDFKVRGDAQEQLINWGWYGVPHYVSIMESGDEALRAPAASWLLKSAERVATGEEGGELSERQALLNAEINTENKIFKIYKGEGGEAALLSWYHGSKDLYPTDLEPDAVKKAVERDEDAKFSEWGPRAVPALVALILEDEDLRGRAIKWLVAAGQRPAEGDDAETVRLQNQALKVLAWDSSASEARQEAGVGLVRDWWEGAAPRWDYSGIRWMGVLFLETQFARYWSNLVRLDLGNSTAHKVPVIDLILDRLKYSLTLALSSLILAYLISIPIGIASAKWHNRPGERATSLVLFALYSLPSFYVATLMVKYLAVGQPGSLEIIPDGRFEDMDAWRLPTWEWIKNIMWHVAAPIACMTYASFAALSRYAKTGVLNVIRSDYVRTARAKGVKEHVVIIKHAARNGLIPIVTLLGTTLPIIVSGSFIIEVIFSIPGFGQLAVSAIFGRDYNVVVGIQLVVAVLTMLGLLLSDLLYAVVDPRISLS